MSLTDTIKNIFVAPDEGSDYEEETQLNEEELEEEQEEEPKKFSFSGLGISRHEKEAPAAEPKVAPKNMDNERTMNIRTSGQLRVILVKPTHFDEAKAIADQMIDNNTILLNLENADDAEARRLIDFLSGVVYARKGKIQPHGRKTVILAPNGVEIMGDNFFHSMDSSADPIF